MLFAGISFFLLGMFHIEDGLKQLEGRTFKLFLRRYTANRFSAILSGIVATGILQSSSIVNLMLLSLAGAGAISMRNVMGVILGSNVGGTINSWLFVLGFKADLDVVMFPLLGLAGIAMAMTRQSKKYYTIFLSVMGLGFIFLGLEFMKNSMTQLINQVDISVFRGHNPLLLLLAGFVVTVLAQASSATVAIVLSSLYSQMIELETAIVLVLGAELGTTIKLLIGSVGGAPIKKRLAVGNLLLNVFTSLLGVLFLKHGVFLLRQIMGFNDPLIILVAFQSLVNIVGALVSVFFLGYFTRLLEQFFTKNERNATQFIRNASPEITGDAEDMLEKEAALFLYRVIRLNMDVFKIKPGGAKQHQPELPSYTDYSEEYMVLKQAEGEILSFYSRVLENSPAKESLLRMTTLIDAVKNAMYAAKGMKDIRHDLDEFSRSGNDFKYGLYIAVCAQQNELYRKLDAAFWPEGSTGDPDKLDELAADIKNNYEAGFHNVYRDASKDMLKTIDISTFLNINRELYSSSQSIIAAMKNYLQRDNKKVIPESNTVFAAS